MQRLPVRSAAAARPRPAQGLRSCATGSAKDITSSGATKLQKLQTNEFLVEYLEQHRERRVAIGDRAVDKQRCRALLHLFDYQAAGLFGALERIHLPGQRRPATMKPSTAPL